jgi:hypothetical protein
VGRGEAVRRHLIAVLSYFIFSRYKEGGSDAKRSIPNGGQRKD